MCSDTSVWCVHLNVQSIRQLTNCTCLTCACKCAESYTSLTAHFIHISVTRLTFHLHEHIGLHVLMHTSGECLTCACKCAESQTIGSLHIFMHISVIGLTAQLHKHIRQSDHSTFACTRQVLVNVLWPVCLTCACNCEESQKIRSLHIFMHTSVTGLTAQLREPIGQSDQCTFTCAHQVYVNVQWLRCMKCAFKCAVNQTID